MKNDMNQEDQLLKDLFRKSETTPTFSISEQVMQRIDQSSEIFEYKPTIGKNAWITIGSIFSLVIIYLILQLDDVSVKSPEILSLVGSGFTKLRSSFSFDLGQIQFPETPSTLLVVVAAFNVIGIYLMISYRWSKKLFRK